MGKSREIKKRMKAVGNIRRITRTMQMIATSKFARAQQAATASKPYTQALFGLVSDLAGGEGVDSPLLQTPGADGARPASGRELTLVLTSDRGLAGPYNGSVLRLATRHLREHAPADPAKGGEVEMVGKKGAGIFRFNNIPVTRQHTQFGDKPRFEEVERLAQEYIERFAAGEIDAVRVVYMKFISTGTQRPEVLQLLPFQKPAAAPAAKAEAASVGDARDPAPGVPKQFEFTPSPTELLETLLPAAVKAQLFQCFNDAVVSEHVARMVAMKAATDNAGKMRNRLKRDYNRARQAQITTELTEIISGAAALG